MNNQHEAAGSNAGARVLLWLGLVAFFAYSVWAIVDLQQAANPVRHRSLFRILAALARPRLLEVEITRHVAAAMWETIQIAFLATAASAAFSSALAFLSARPASGWDRGLGVLLGLVATIVRSIHPMIVTIPAVVLAGVGPTAAVLALTVFTTAVLAQDFADYARRHSSLGWPELLGAHFPGLAFRRLPVSILIASVLGFAGGGGIGFVLQQHLNLLEYRAASVGLLACILAIGAVDVASRAVWRGIESRGTSPPYAADLSDLA